MRARQGPTSILEQVAHAQKPRGGREALLCTFHKAYGTAWGTATIFATAGTPAVLSTKSI